MEESTSYLWPTILETQRTRLEDWRWIPSCGTFADEPTRTEIPNEKILFLKNGTEDLNSSNSMKKIGRRKMLMYRWYRTEKGTYWLWNLQLFGLDTHNMKVVIQNYRTAKTENRLENKVNSFLSFCPQKKTECLVLDGRTNLSTLNTASAIMAITRMSARRTQKIFSRFISFNRQEHHFCKRDSAQNFWISRPLTKV